MLRDRVLGAGDDHRARAVDRGDRHTSPSSSGTTSSSAACDGDHRAARRQRLHQPAARGDQRAGVLERQHPGDVRGGDLADRVAGDESGPHAPRLQQPEQRDLEGEQRGLGELGAVQQLAGRAEHTSRSGPAVHVEVRAAPRRTPRRTPGTRAYSSRPMPARCAPWPVNRNAEPPRRAPGADDARAAAPSAARPARPAARRGRRRRRRARCSQRGARRGQGAGRRRPATAGRRQAGAAARPARAARPAPRADSTQGDGRPRPAALAAASGSAGACSRIDVRVGAADAERGDAGAARAVRVAGHGTRLGQQLDRARRTSRRAATGSSACRVRGSTPCRIARTILITPATPAAAWVWPMFDFTEPSHSGRSSARSWP